MNHSQHEAGLEPGRGAASTGRRALWRSRWAAFGAAVAVSLGAGGLFVAQAAPGPAESTIVSVTPARILDTRDPVNVGLPGPFVSATSQKLQVTGAIPTATGVQTVVPTGATGVLLNVTPVGASADGFISIRPGDATGAPTTSSLNFTKGDILPNAVQVAVPTSGANAGKIEITFDAYGVAGPTTDILVDVVGYTTNAGLQELVADVAGKVTGGPITMSIGPGSYTTTGDGTINLRQSSVGARATGDGFMYLSLTGPETRGGVEYTLKELTYCVRGVTGGGGIDIAVVVGYDVVSDPETGDATNRTATGCYTLTPNSATRAGRGFQFYLGTLGPGSVTIGNVTTTWDTRAALGALEEATATDGSHADGG